MSEGLSGCVAVVTGGARGIGRATVLELARVGVKVVFNDLDEAASDELTREGEARGAAIDRVLGDAGTRGVAEQTIDLAIRRFGRVDLLVNNAAASVRKSLVDLSAGDVEDTLRSCFWPVFHTTQLVVRHLLAREGEGSIVTVGSINATATPHPGASAYNAAKAAVHQLSLTWAAELAPHGIRVNIVEPGWTDTPGERVQSGESAIRHRGRLLPLKRLAHAEEIARAIRFLLDPTDASYITGSVLRVDGAQCLPPLPGRRTAT